MKHYKLTANKSKCKNPKSFSEILYDEVSIGKILKTRQGRLRNEEEETKLRTDMFDQ